MRLLVQPQVIRSAIVATLITALACLPRLITWPGRPYPLIVMWLVLAWAGFVLWSFVFAWHAPYSEAQPFRIKRDPNLWITATLCGIAGSFVLHLVIDPTLRSATPQDYPATWGAWIAMSLFLLTFDQLFLCFAPFAFFVRLLRSPSVAGVFTVVLGAFLLWLKFRRMPEGLSDLFVLELFGWRLLAGSVSVYFLIRGGIWMTLWWVALLQLRHLIALR